MLGQPFTRIFVDIDGDVLLFQLGFQLDDKLVDDVRHHLGRQGLELNHRVESISEFRGEHPLDRGHAVP